MHCSPDALLDEVFGSENFVATIVFSKTTSSTSGELGGTIDFIHWYARDIERLKSRQLFRTKALGGAGAGMYRFVELPDGTRRALTREEHDDPGLLPERSKTYRRSDLRSQAMGRTKGEGAASWFEVHLMEGPTRLAQLPDGRPTKKE